MNLQHLGTDYGGWWIDLDMLPSEGMLLDCGVGTDMSFAEALHKYNPKIRAVMVDHTDDAEKFVTKTRGYDWAFFVKAAVVGKDQGHKITMYRHKTRSGSESKYDDHRFADPLASYEVDAVSLASLVQECKPCVVKLDIEGAEYDCALEAIGAPQVCIEFHHRMMSRFDSAKTDAILTAFIAAGYIVAHRTPTDEVLLVLK